MRKPNYNDLGLSATMGPKLRTFVERQLLWDLANYSVTIENLKFDWLDSCIEGRDTSCLDGQLENFSGITVYDINDKLVADGWMDFIHEGDFFLAYWDFITVWQGNRKVLDKTRSGIPDHIWRQIPESIQWNYKQARY
ncbi:hypothetical protein WBJ53_21820 [Spirosoma sp. SC4-14]|uniref:hypothetical protein n=1 Tax=Spirosoma sp. SC4-14 TaxID=3128900 RepID=UPI0030CAE78F